MGVMYFVTKTGQVLFVDGNKQLDKAYNFAKTETTNGIYWLDQLEPAAKVHRDTIR